MPIRKGIILAGGNGTRLYPLTLTISKQLLPIYDKPLIFYPLSVLMLAGIREILLICTPHDLCHYQNLFKDGSSLGINIQYAIQDHPKGLVDAFLIGEQFINKQPVTLILGDNFFYGQSFTDLLQICSKKEVGATIFGYKMKDPRPFGVVEFDAAGKALSIEEKPSNPKSNYVVPGIYFYDDQVVDLAKQIKPSVRGELEITDLNQLYLQKQQLHVEILGRGFAWLDAGSHSTLLEASLFVETIEKRQGYKIACLEEIAYRSGWISKELMRKQSELYAKSSYGIYLNEFLEGRV